MSQPDLSKLREDASYCFKRADEISKQVDSDGLLTDEQKAEIKALHVEGNGYLDQIKAVEDTQAVQKDAENTYQKHLKPRERQVPQAQPGDNDVYEARHLEIPSTHPSRYEAFGKGKDAERDAHMSGLWITSKMFGALQTKKVYDAERQLRDYFPEVEHRALGTTTNAAGGATVPQELAAAIIERREQYGVFESLTNVVPLNAEALWPRVTSDQLATFGVEGTAITEADATFDDIVLKPQSLRTISRINNELINSSSVDIAGFVAQDFGRRFAQRLDTAGFTANAETANGGLTGVVRLLQKTTGLTGNIPGTGNTFSATVQGDLEKLSGILPEYAVKGEAFWICSRACKEALFGRLQMASGGVTKQETSQGTIDSYMGFGIVTTQLMPSSTAAMSTDDVFLLLGDLKLASMMGISDQLTFTTSGERYFEFNQTAIRGVMSADINIYDTGSTSAAGSIVALRSI